MTDDHKLTVGTYVRARHGRDWYVGVIVRFDGEFMIIKRQLKTGEAFEFRAHEDDVQYLPKSSARWW